jgi:hypothetical protein
MVFAAFHREQTAQTTDVGRGDFQFRVAQFELVFEHADRLVVAARAKYRILDVGDGPEQLDLGFLAGVETFN